MSRNPTAHSYSGIHAPDTRPKVKHQPKASPTITKPTPSPTLSPTMHNVLRDPQVLDLLRAAALMNLDEVVKRQGSEPYAALGMLINELEGPELFQLTMVLDLTGHLIDTEIKYAKGVLKVEDFHKANRATRKRLKAMPPTKPKP